jgi:rfaE bifunctional protein nucleotidyltransferase chain/domain
VQSTNPITGILIDLSADDRFPFRVLPRQLYLSLQKNILSLAETDQWVAEQRASGQKFGFTCGAFDIMHAGHAQYLGAARAACDRLLVAVNSDASIQRYKSPLRPVNPWQNRAFVVAAMRSVDAVTMLDEDRPLPLIQRWKPDFYIKGGDYKTTALRSSSVVEEYGGQTVVIPVEFDTSTTRIFEYIQALEKHAVPERTHNPKPAGLVIFDRDGTLIRDGVFDPTQIELIDGVPEALLLLQNAGFRLCIASNQQGIGLGYFGYRDFIDGNRILLRKLGAAGICIAKIYFCPHSFADICDCRKPAPGLLTRAMHEQGVPADRTFVVGDSAADVEAAALANCQAFYVGRETARLQPTTILEAARTITSS